jgi:hypothetical protein
MPLQRNSQSFPAVALSGVCQRTNKKLLLKEQGLFLVLSVYGT